MQLVKTAPNKLTRMGRHGHTDVKVDPKIVHVSAGRTLDDDNEHYDGDGTDVMRTNDECRYQNGTGNNYSKHFVSRLL